MRRVLWQAAISVFVGLSLPVLGDDERPVARGVNSIPDFAGVIGSSKLRPVSGARKVIVR